ncbi:MAG: hypothetical protein ACRDPY_24165 [Streptosporangiaceae bacterium]
MSDSRTDGPDGQPRTMTSADITGLVRDFNASNQAHEALWTRVLQAGDAVRRAVHDRDAAQLRARHARSFHLAIQAEYPHRTSPLLRQVFIAMSALGLDTVACWFAAQALGDGQVETLLWTVLFLAVLAGGEVSLDYYSDRGGRAWRLLVTGLVAFVTGLGILRFLFLATVSAVGTAAALVGAALFTAATAAFVLIGYRALRAAEKLPAWRARRWSRQADREAGAASHRVSRLLRERNRLMDAYISRIRGDLLGKCSSGQLPQLEAALREHLAGGEQP